MILLTSSTVGKDRPSHEQRHPVGTVRAGTLRRTALLAIATLAALLLAGCALDSQPAGFTPGSLVAPDGAAVAVPQPAAEQSAAQANVSEEALDQALAFAGAIDALPADGTWAGLWQVSGQAVRVGPTTQIDERQGKLQPGARVAVEGWQETGGALNAGWVHVLGDKPAAAAAGAARTGGDITARVALTVPVGAETPEPVIKGSPSRWVTDTIHPVEYRGLVQALPAGTMAMTGTGTLTGTWTIGGHIVNVGTGTDLKLQLGKLEAGAYVQVIGWLQPDGSIDASKILVKKLNPGQGKPQPPTGGITNTVPPTNTLPGAIRPGGGGDDDEPEDQADGNRNWDVHLHGPVDAGGVITSTGGLTYTVTVNGQQVVVDASTWLKAGRQPADGDWLQVKGLLQPDGTVLATSIQWVHRTPVQSGKPGDKGNGKMGTMPVVTTTPMPGQRVGPGSSGRGGIKIMPPGKSGGQGNAPGKAPTRRPPIKPGQGNGNGHGYGNGNGNGDGNGHK